MRALLLAGFFWIPAAYSAGLWTSIIQSFGLPEAPADTRMIVEQSRWLKGGLLDKLAQARPWLFYVYQETQRAGLPSEIALLPFVESAWDPTAKSHVGASGMWQFMDGTARDYQVQTQGQCDGRQDIIQSTGSAIRLLEDLKNEFGDWSLALAAYNAGAKRVRDAQKKNLANNRSTDFWALDSLAQETQLYVPRLLALRELLKEQLVLDEPLPWLPYQQIIRVVDSPAGDWSTLGSNLGFDPQTLELLNPCWKSGPKVASLLLVPVDARRESWVRQWLD